MQPQLHTQGRLRLLLQTTESSASALFAIPFFPFGQHCGSIAHLLLLHSNRQAFQRLPASLCSIQRASLPSVQRDHFFMFPAFSCLTFAFTQSNFRFRTASNQLKNLFPYISLYTAYTLNRNRVTSPSCIT